MGKLSTNLSRYVAARWTRLLVERVLRPTPTLQAFVAERSRKTDFFDYGKAVDVQALAKHISERDRAGESASTWTRAIRRWLSEGGAPEPDYIRRTLEVLGFDWVIGLGRCGYAQHALAMLHVLWSRGSRSRVAAQARAIFTGSDYERGEVGNRAARAFTRISAKHLERLHDAAIACWGNRKSDLRVPTRCVLPRDFPASRHLYAAWMLLDTAILNRHGSIEQRLGAVNESVAREVDWWIADILPTKKKQIVQKISTTLRRKK